MLKRLGRAVVAALVATTVVALAGCAPLFPTGPQQLFESLVVPESEIRLGDAVMAFFIGQQNSQMGSPFGEVREPGFVVLVNADGAVRAVRTERMDMMALAWSDHGLDFADENNDYRLTGAGLTKTANPKSTAQNLMFVLRSGESVGVYNGGNHGGGSYINQIGVTTDGAARRYDVQGNYFTGALCDDEVFGLTNDPGTHRREATALPGMTSTADPASSPQMLARLYPADGGEQVIAWRPAFGGGTAIGHIPCQNGILTFLSRDTDAQGNTQRTVVTWDTRTGAYQAHPLIFDGTETTDFYLNYFGYAVQDLQDGHLHWVHEDGRVFSTDVATGQTTTLFATGLETGTLTDMHTIFSLTGNQLHALSTTRDAEGDITYTVFDRATGEVVHKVSIPNQDVDRSYLNLSHMAVRPES